MFNKELIIIFNIFQPNTVDLKGLTLQHVHYITQSLKIAPISTNVNIKIVLCYLNLTGGNDDTFRLLDYSNIHQIDLTGF